MADKKVDKICEDCESNYGYKSLDEIECVSEEPCLMGSAYKSRKKIGEDVAEHPCTGCGFTEPGFKFCSCPADCIDGNSYTPITPDMEPIDNGRTREQIEADTQRPIIKDSGERTDFGTGAVRDMHAGKGRCDLLPANALLRLAKHFETGAEKYGDRNWELGIPCHSFADSALRHYLKYMAGETDEDHLIAAVWNLVCLVETEMVRPHMMDIPSRMKPKESTMELYADGKKI